MQRDLFLPSSYFRDLFTPARKWNNQKTCVRSSETNVNTSDDRAHRENYSTQHAAVYWSLSVSLKTWNSWIILNNLWKYETKIQKSHILWFCSCGIVARGPAGFCLMSSENIGDKQNRTEHHTGFWWDTDGRDESELDLMLNSC